MPAARLPVLHDNRAYADAAQTEAALANLTSSDLVRLTRIAKARALNLVDYEWQDLFNEAVSRLLGGSRRWPTEVPIVAFLAQTMRSIASEQQRHAIQRGISVDPDDVPALASEEPSPERSVQAQQLLTFVLGQFADDNDISIYISGYERGETTGQTMARTGISAARLDAARKRMRRRLDRLMDEGYL
jgi:RNA polymerase sigma-70 factor (ECF subfamily)